MKTTQVNPGEIRLKGRPEEDGIAFLLCNGSHLYQGRQVTLNANGRVENTPFYGDMENANIEFIIENEAFFGNIDHARIDYKIERMNEKVTKILVSVFFTLIALSIATVFLLKLLHTFMYVMLVITGVVLLLNEVVTFTIFRLKKDEEIESYLKFLAAMNSTRNAYYKLNRVPTLTEAMQYSPISSESRYLNKTYLLTAACYVILMDVIPNLWLMLLFLVLLVTAYICENKRKVYFWQYAIYSKPEQIHYGVAISALQGAVQEMENELKAQAAREMENVRKAQKELISTINEKFQAK